ncbi:methyltransferase domain-containing protein [Synechococcus sp. 1G10]|uniref:class I SAM-dependent methyltransferase n=1 Tax=Synechococcus sp. 1G10 TaxID=2025605 RepID=UPI000B98930E|nr:methyltransferase domain-containing protein [Synechococcus sp. 1G10]
MRHTAKALLKKAQLLSFAKELLHSHRSTLRKMRGVDNQIASQYLTTAEIAKLHIGCGNNFMSGWLNSDFHPSRPGVMHLDAAKLFPFDDNIYHHVYSEHMIEHIPYEEGAYMLRECYRVMKKNSRIRIATPDLQFLIDLYRNCSSTFEAEYIEWSTENFIQYAPYPCAGFVVNNFFRDFDHQFIYDEETLRASLSNAGFSEIKKCGLGKSEDGALQNLEHAGQRPSSFYQLETMVFEAQKL